MDDDAHDGCCTWLTFKEGFLEYWPKYFGAPPLLKDWQKARRDWRAGSTGYEAARIAEQKSKRDIERAACKPLVCIGGRNYAHAGSELALKYGKKE
jgi:hypothetical protein